MIKIEKTEVFGFEAAIRGMRNPFNSGAKTDSGTGCITREYGREIETGAQLCKNCAVMYESKCVCFGKKQWVIGSNDLTLMKKLVAAGTDHSKFMRMINVTCDIVAPLFWVTEHDTYKVSTVRNSCSKMHTIHIKEFKIDDFSHESIDCVNGDTRKLFENYISHLETLRQLFNRTNEKKYWRALIEMLPQGYNIRYTWQANYQVLRNIYHARKNHKLNEWREFCKWVATLPGSELITGDM